MKKIIITDNQLTVIKKHILESINPLEATTHLNSLLTVVNKKRNVGFYGGATKDDLINLKKSGLKFIDVGMNRAYVFYNDGFEAEANELANIARKFEGYLPSTGNISFDGIYATAEEVYRIGILLGYDEYYVKKHVLKYFPTFKG